MTWKGKSAVYALNKYTWALLKENLGWTEFQGVPRIIPIAQQPELMQDGKTFIVYGSAFQPPNHLYALNTESIAYTIYGTSATEVDNVANMLYEVFKRQDEAAADVNAFANSGVSFGSVRCVMTANAEPADQEGGFVSALVMLEVKYTVDQPPIVTSLTATP